MEKKYYIGLDVHKRQTTYAVKDLNGTTLDSGEVATQFSDLQSVLVEYIDNSIIAMEACTNYYHLYQKMKEKKIDVRVANVIHLRKLIGKNDHLDATRLADMLRLNAVPESYIPDNKIQNLRTLISLYHGLIQEKVRFKNQMIAFLDRNGIPMPVQDPFSKKGIIWIKQYLQENNDFALRILLESLKSTIERANQAEFEIIGFLKNNYPKEYELLRTIPGIGEVLVGYLIAEICPIERFANKKKLRRYAGVIPIKEQSDKKVYATYLPKHASRKLLRYALVLAANCAVRTNCRLKEYYKKKKKGSNHSHAVMCVASSMSDIIYNVLKTKQPYSI